MVVKSQLKLIKSLHQKKYRSQHGLFFVEGIKVVTELLQAQLKPYCVLTSDDSLLKDAAVRVDLITEKELKQISALKTPNKILAVFHMPETKSIDFSKWILVLDDVRDPGNLGTIIRLCDWYDIKQLVCSKKTVDCYNPKVLQASMGSIARVDVVYENLEIILKESKVPVYGSFMDGASVYTQNLPEKGILVMGNEANGISEVVNQLVSQKIAIPQFGKNTTESLNVATATAILLNEIRRG